MSASRAVVRAVRSASSFFKRAIFAASSLVSKIWYQEDCPKQPVVSSGLSDEPKKCGAFFLTVPRLEQVEPDNDNSLQIYAAGRFPFTTSIGVTLPFSANSAGASGFNKSWSSVLNQLTFAKRPSLGSALSVTIEETAKSASRLSVSRSVFL